MNLSDNSKSLFFSLAAVFLWSTVATVFKLTLEGMNFIQMLFYSSLTSTVALFVIFKRLDSGKFLELFNKAQIKKNLLLGLINPFLFYLLLFKAYDILPAQEALVLNFTWPVVLSIFSIMFLKQKVNATTFIGLFSAFMGVLIITTHGNIFSLKFQNLFGSILALGSTIIWAGFWIINLKDKRPNSLKLFSSFFFGTIYTAIYILFFDEFIIENSMYLFGAVYIGFFEMGITFFFWLKGLELSNNKAKSSTLAYLAPFISFVIISIVLKEIILLSSIVGLCLIISGIFYQQLNSIIKLKKV